MPKRLRPIVLALILAGASAGLLGCGGGGGPAPSIPADSARTLLAKVAEIRANVDVGSCLVASDKTDELIADVQALPSGVNDQVTRALESGANKLKLLLADQCQSRTTTSETTSTTPSTTEGTTTTRTHPSTTTTPTQTEPNTITTPTQTQTTPTTGGSGGIGPGGL